MVRLNFSLFRHRRTLRNLLLLAFALGPALMIHPQEIGLGTGLYEIVFVSLLVFATFACILFVADSTALPELKVAAIVGMGTCYSAWYLLGVHRISTGVLVTPEIAIDNYSILLPTIWSVLGPKNFILGSAALLTGWFACIWVAFRATVTLARLRQNLPWKTQIVAVLAATAFAYGNYFHGYMDIAKANLVEGAEIPLYFPRTDDIALESEDSVFYLQLESGNAAILTQPQTVEGTNYTGDFIPHIKEISKDGVYFPLFWGNSQFTNRAWENILCGITGNTDKAFSYRPEDIRSRCLPKIFKDAGYTTIFFQAYSNLSYFNAEIFAREIGFDEVHGADILSPETKKYPWGFDDCGMYRDAFNYLRERKPDGKKLFVYFAVSSHHGPYSPKPEYAFLNRFQPAKTYLEKYLNSYLAQDYCVKKFYEEYQAYKNSKTHLFISPDHSVGLWANDPGKFSYFGPRSEHFLIHFTYIPSDERKEEFRVGEEIDVKYSETEILPTLMEILGHKPMSGSFYEELKKNGAPKRDKRCAVLLNPHIGPAIVVVRNDMYYEYSGNTGMLTAYDLAKDPYQQQPLFRYAMPMSQFKRQYYCEKYLGGE